MMNRKRLGQCLLAGVFTVCAAVIAALVDLVAKEEAPKQGEELAETAPPAEE